MLLNHRLKTFHMGKKARAVTIGERGKETIFITPKPKQVIEVNGWVAREKAKMGLFVVLTILVGAVVSLLGWKALLVACLIGFLIGLCIGGDRETSP